MNNDWQPAIIAPKEHIAMLHTKDGSDVWKHAGKRIRVRPTNELDKALVEEGFRLEYGCSGELIEVHPKDAIELWPSFFTGVRIGICTCAVFLD